MACTEHTVTILRDGLTENVSRDRVSKAPPAPAQQNEAIPTTLDDNPAPPTSSTVDAPKAVRSNTAPAEAERQVMDALVDYDTAKDQFRVRWHGYSASEDTWEPPGHIPFNAMYSYFSSRRQRLPRHLRHFSATN